MKISNNIIIITIINIQMCCAKYCPKGFVLIYLSIVAYSET